MGTKGYWQKRNKGHNPANAAARANGERSGDTRKDALVAPSVEGDESFNLVHTIYNTVAKHNYLTAQEVKDFAKNAEKNYALMDELNTPSGIPGEHHIPTEVLTTFMGKLRTSAKNLGIKEPIPFYEPRTKVQTSAIENHGKAVDPNTLQR